MPRRLSSTGSLLPHQEKWLLTVKTSNKGWFSGTGTDANIFVVIYDEKGAKSPIIKLKNEGKTFDSGRQDKFKFITENISAVQKLTVWHDNTGYKADWHVNSAMLENLRSGQTFVFNFDTWICGHDVIESPVLGHLKNTVEYEAKFVTASGSLQGTKPNVFLNILGTEGETRYRLLKKSQNSYPFQTGQLDTFKILAVALGDIKGLKMKVENGKTNWHLERIDIGIVGQTTVMESFKINKWIVDNTEVAITNPTD